MAVRIKESIPPYKGGTGIEITNNHIINVLLREANNLIHVNENNELYVDLQLDDGIAPDDDFPVGVTTGKILQEDGWQQSGLILNRKTTSGDYNRLIYANDGNLYIDFGDGVWHLLGSGSSLLDCNTRTFYLPNNVTDANPDLTIIQEAMDWYNSGKNAILWFRDKMYVFEDNTYAGSQTDPYLTYISTEIGSVSWESSGTAYYGYDKLKIMFNDGTSTVKKVSVLYKEVDNAAHGVSFIPTDTTLRTPFMATQDSHPISKKYLDLELAKKQDLLTAGQRISIVRDPNTGDVVISADVSGAMTYKGNVTDPTQLPATGNTQGDCWYSESDGHLYAWDGTQWKDVGGTGVNYSAGTGISVNNNVISNTLPFNPSNQGAVGQVLKLTANGYEWQDDNDTTYSEGTGIHIDGNNVISNTGVLSINSQSPDGNGNIDIDEFSPENAGTMGQVLQKTNIGYKWVNVDLSNSYTPGTGINITQNKEIENTLPFNPDNAGSNGQVLKKTQNGYEWQNESGGGTQYSAGNGIDIDSNNVISNEGVITVNGQSPDQNGNINVSGTNYTSGNGINITNNDVIENTLPFDPDNSGRAGQVLKKTNSGYRWENESGGGTNYSAGQGIDITNDIISNDGVITINNQSPDSNGNINIDEFNPGSGTVGQVLTKTQNGYEWSDFEIPSGDNNVKFWNVDSRNMSSSTEAEIIAWVTASPYNGAIINDSHTNDVFIYDHTTTVGQYTSCIFFGVNRNTEKHTDSSNYDYTVGYQNRLTIATNGSTYSTLVDENPDPLTHTNYLSVTTSSGYSAANAFMPTEDYQPATKKYVDSVAGGISNDTTGTTTVITKIRAGTSSELASLSSRNANTVYLVKDA